MLSTTLALTDSHRNIPPAEEWTPVADAFSGPLDGYALWLATEGRPKSPAPSGTTSTARVAWESRSCSSA
jgi:hypothetical protein